MLARTRHTQSTLWSSELQRNKPFIPWERVSDDTLWSPVACALTRPAQDAQNRRRSLTLQSLSRVPPNSEEAAELHQTFLNYGQEDTFGLQSDNVWMGNTKLEKTMLMFPQERK